MIDQAHVPSHADGSLTLVERKHKRVNLHGNLLLRTA
jgi:hypothetical protein